MSTRRGGETWDEALARTVFGLAEEEEAGKLGKCLTRVIEALEY